MSQEQELSRVNHNISRLVADFVRHRSDTNQPRFFMRDLHDYIFQRTRIAPASPDRILRQLRLDGKCNYKIVNRRASQYELVPYELAA